jgi:hypothetical protein
VIGVTSGPAARNSIGTSCDDLTRRLGDAGDPGNPAC